MGLSAGRVPSRVDACVKAGLLDLVDHAVDAGWSPRRAAARLGVDDSRLARWQHRRAAASWPTGPRAGPAARPAGRRTGRDPGVVHSWGEIDRSHRKLAHRGSRLGLVHVSESTVLRVLAAEGIALPGNPRGTRRQGRRGRTGWNGNRTASGPTTSSATRRHDTEWRCKTATAALSQQDGEAGGSLTRETPGRAASSPDNDGTRQHYRMARARQARREGVREEPAL